MVVEIPLSQRKGSKYKGMYVAIVSDEDADLAKLNWAAAKPGSSKTFYATNVKSPMMHRVVLSRVLGRELTSKDIVDHIDGNGINNCRDNLRLASITESNSNRSRLKNNASGYKGVHWSKKSKKWQAVICANKKVTHLGYFDKPEEAYEVYCKAATELHGEFARIA